MLPLDWHSQMLCRDLFYNDLSAFRRRFSLFFSNRHVFGRLFVPQGSSWLSWWRHVAATVTPWLWQRAGRSSAGGTGTMGSWATGTATASADRDRSKLCKERRWCRSVWTSSGDLRTTLPTIRKPKTAWHHLVQPWCVTRLSLLSLPSDVLWV